MDFRRLNHLLGAASAAHCPDSQAGRARQVLARIASGWDPERIEWQQWLRRWWPWVAVTVLASAWIVAALPHDGHAPAEPQPPVMELFRQPAGNPDMPAAP
jgi:hypothetical protein